MEDERKAKSLLIALCFVFGFSLGFYITILTGTNTLLS
ncbi:MAG: hypothetical protein CM15mP19_07420 [Gammaproteobacteria bacterium]|nr:MAG: hypothetical protein CM15mP19_07420 [Gammaproteobacteria bacterium]